jgi:hypothetical protein
MAVCAKHGQEIGTIHYLTKAKRYMSDGTILKNHGEGWKLHGKVRAGIDPATAYQNAKARADESLLKHPATAEYRRQLHALCGMSKRWQLNATVAMMPEDPDGVWSEVCDDWRNLVDADLDDIVKLCQAYQAAVKETRDTAPANTAATSEAGAA